MSTWSVEQARGRIYYEDILLRRIQACLEAYNASDALAYVRAVESLELSLTPRLRSTLKVAWTTDEETDASVKEYERKNSSWFEKSTQRARADAVDSHVLRLRFQNAVQKFEEVLGMLDGRGLLLTYMGTRVMRTTPAVVEKDADRETDSAGDRTGQ